jgi:acyl carrier protein
MEHNLMTDHAHDLREFIRENFLYGKEPNFSDDDSFLEMGIIDSTGVLELVAHLEGRHGFTVEDDELVPENLDSIHNLVKFIGRKTQHLDVSA